jgi:hypothetical protein
MATDQVGLRAAATRETLKRARAAIPRVAELDPELGGRLSVRFDLLATEIEDGLDDDGSRESTTDLIRRGEELIGETLAFVGGAAARRLDLDGGVTSLALAWLDALSGKSDLPKVGVVIPASTEFTGMLTQVIRLRLPSDGIWGLPVAVHEYGHFVASVLARRETQDGMPKTVIPIEAQAHGAGSHADLPRLYWHGHELFADAFAAVTAGPAYTRYCVHHRFDACNAQTFTGTHPEPARRVRIQLEALRLIATGKQRPYITDAVSALAATWEDAVVKAGGDPAVRVDAALDQLEQDLLALLGDGKLKALRYRDHVPARRLAQQALAKAKSAGSVTEALNAAWIRRLKLDPGESADVIAADCERLVKGVLGRG